jgi:hypothetical protein
VEGSRYLDMRSITRVITRLRRGRGRANYPTSRRAKQWHQAETITTDDAIAAEEGNAGNASPRKPAK